MCGYALDRLRLLFSSSPLHSTVKLLAADKKHVYAATENTISILSDKAQGVGESADYISTDLCFLVFEKHFHKFSEITPALWRLSRRNKWGK